MILFLKQKQPFIETHWSKFIYFNSHFKILTQRYNLAYM